MKLSISMVMSALRDIPTQQLTKQARYEFSAIRMFSPSTMEFSGEVLYVAREEDVYAFLRLRDPSALDGICVLCLCSVSFSELEIVKRGSFILVPKEYSYAGIFTILQDFFDAVEQWCVKLDRIILENGGFQKMIDVSASFIKNPVFVWDFSLRSQAHSPIDAAPAAASWKAFVESGGFSQSTVEWLIEKRMFTTPEYDGTMRYISGDELPSGHDLYSKTFFRDGFRMFSIACTICNEQPDEVQLELMDFFFNKVLEYGERNVKNGFQFQHFHEIFLKELIEGKTFSQSELRERANTFQLPLDTNWKLILIEMKYGSKTALQYLAEIVRVYSFQLKVLVYNGRIVALREENPHTLSSVAEQKRYERDWKALQNLLRTYDAYAAISMAFISLEHISFAYKQAEFALKYGKLLVGDSKSVFYYDRYIVFHLLEQFESSIPLYTLCSPEMVKVWADDKDKKKNNIELLETFFSCNCSISDCAAALNMHRNSVSYRIRYLIENYRLPLDKWWGQLQISTTLRVFKYLEILGREKEIEALVPQEYEDE